MQTLGLSVIMREAAQEEDFKEAGQMQYEEAVTAFAISEGYDPLEMRLALEDRGWQRMGTQLDGEQPWIVRRLSILRARMYWLLDPHATAAVRTWTNYTVGTGISFKAEDEAIDNALQKFWKSPKNRTMTSAAGQQKHNRRLLVDGEMFFAIFDDDPAPSIRKVDCVEITQFIYDPEDAEVIWAFRRERTMPSGERDIKYYRNWAFPEQELSGVEVKNENGGAAIGIAPEEGVLMYHLAFDAIHQRGNSLFSSSLAWMTSMRGFMQDRIAITKGLARYIQKLTVKGGSSQIAKIATAMNRQQQTGVAGRAVPPGTGPAATAAKTFLENGNVELSNMPRTTGASDAKTDFKTIRLMIAGGVGMTEPYFGDAESGNLATATAMELPMLKQFQSHQKLWGDAWVDMFTIVMYFMGVAGTAKEMEAIEVDVDFPPIVEADITKIVVAIVSACAEFPELKQPETLKLLLITMGVNNVDDVMERVLVDQKANQVKADNIAGGKAPDGSPMPVTATPVVVPAKPVKQATQPGGQPIAAPTMKEAVDLFHQVLLLETEAMNTENQPV